MNGSERCHIRGTVKKNHARETALKVFLGRRLRANTFGQKFSDKKVSGDIIQAKVFSRGWLRANGWECSYV